ncbi:MAG: hypothetical protein K0V04_09120 [Deltaproteobacteria bacterium]|nr:hypothetical protein [Deltaproteobacteria bacterium]
MKRTIASIITLGVIIGTGCAADEAADDFRILPVGASMPDGETVFVGTYEEKTDELVLLPAFVEQVQQEAETGTLVVLGADSAEVLAGTVPWATSLDVGSRLEIGRMIAGGEVVVGGALVVHDEQWTDGLTEAEAASSYAACWDPEPLDPSIPPDSPCQLIPELCLDE